MRRRTWVVLRLASAGVLAIAPALADEPEDVTAPPPPVAPATTTPPVTPPPPAPPAPTEPTPRTGPFAIDPLADGALITSTTAFAGILELINSTGEVRPQQISPTFSRSSLLSIDRSAVSQTVDKGARPRSNVGLALAGAFAVVDPILSGLRERNVRTGIVDAVIYAESAATTWGVTNLAKMAIRRPRPQAYIDAQAHKNDPNWSNSDTDSTLSFFSGHASMTATISATATYLAFARDPNGVRPWVTLGVGTAVTTFVSIERVRGGAHFPTDVIAGAIAGAGIGVIVPHLHRTTRTDSAICVGYASEPGGGTLQLTGLF